MSNPSNAAHCTVHYLGNSGFSLALGGDLLIFDYAPLRKAPLGGLSHGGVDAASLRMFSRISVFVSHVHPDHFQKTIFGWLDWHEAICFILSSDIRPQCNAAIRSNARIHWVSEHQTLSLPHLHLTAYGSTDAGVSFDARIADRRIFHAGDLNFWHWRNEGDAAWTTRQDAEFRRILGEIPVTPPIDLAFFPTDARMGDDFYRGAIQFAQRFSPRMFIPMHFGGADQLPASFNSELASYCRQTALFHPGASASFDLDVLSAR